MTQTAHLVKLFTDSWGKPTKFRYNYICRKVIHNALGLFHVFYMDLYNNSSLSDWKGSKHDCLFLWIMEIRGPFLSVWILSPGLSISCLAISDPLFMLRNNCQLKASLMLREKGFIMIDILVRFKGNISIDNGYHTMKIDLMQTYKKS